MSRDACDVQFVLEKLGQPKAVIGKDTKIAEFLDSSLFQDSGTLNADGREYLQYLSGVIGVEVGHTDTVIEVAASFTKQMLANQGAKCK